MADLYPIVVPAIEYKAVKYTYTGEGLFKKGHPYDPNAEELIPLKAQHPTKSERDQSHIGRPNLRLREAKKKMLPDLKATESQLNKEFKKENKSARDGAWNKLKSAEQKARADFSKYLREAFLKRSSGRPANLDIVVLKIRVDERSKVTNAAEKMRLETVSVDAPWTRTKAPSPNRWLIIGRTRDAVWEQMRDIERQTSRSRQEYGADKQKQNSGNLKLAVEAKPSKPVSPYKSTLNRPYWSPAASNKPSNAFEGSKYPKFVPVPSQSSSFMNAQASMQSRATPYSFSGPTVKTAPSLQLRSTPYGFSGPVIKTETLQSPNHTPKFGGRTK